MCRARGEVMESVRKAAEMVIEEVITVSLEMLNSTVQSLNVFLFNSVSAPVQESPLELLHHSTWDQRIWQSDASR